MWSASIFVIIFPSADDLFRSDTDCCCSCSTQISVLGQFKGARCTSILLSATEFKYSGSVGSLVPFFTTAAFTYALLRLTSTLLNNDSTVLTSSRAHLPLAVTYDLHNKIISLTKGIHGSFRFSFLTTHDRYSVSECVALPQKYCRDNAQYTAVQQNFIMSASQPNESHQVRLFMGDHLPSTTCLCCNSLHFSH